MYTLISLLELVFVDPVIELLFFANIFLWFHVLYGYSLYRKWGLQTNLGWDSSVGLFVNPRLLDLRGCYFVLLEAICFLIRLRLVKKSWILYLQIWFISLLITINYVAKSYFGYLFIWKLLLFFLYVVSLACLHPKMFMVLLFDNKIVAV